MSILWNIFYRYENILILNLKNSLMDYISFYIIHVGNWFYQKKSFLKQ